MNFAASARVDRSAGFCGCCSFCDTSSIRGSNFAASARVDLGVVCLSCVSDLSALDVRCFLLGLYNTLILPLFESVYTNFLDIHYLLNFNFFDHFLVYKEIKS